MNDGDEEQAKLPDHPLMAAFRDMAKVATTQRGLKCLARIEHGITNRMKWIEARRTQIARLESLRAEVLGAYDAGDDEGMAMLLHEIDQIVNMSEGVSAAEVRVGEVFDAEEVIDSPFPPEMERASKRAFKSSRRTKSENVDRSGYNG